MSNYPVPFHGESNGRWHEDMNEDYRNAKNDDERRQILLAFGYDKAHEAEVIRLFGSPLDPSFPNQSELPLQEEDEIQHKICKQFLKHWKLLACLAGGFVTLTAFLADLPGALQTLSCMRDFLQRLFHL